MIKLGLLYNYYR